MPLEEFVDRLYSTIYRSGKATGSSKTMAPCQLCPPAQPNRAILRRPKTLQPVCQPCFFRVFETEIHHAIMGYGQAEQLDGPVGKGKRPAHDDEEDDGGAITAPPPQPRRRRLFRRGEKVAIGASGGKGAHCACCDRDRRMQADEGCAHRQTRPSWHMS